MRSAANSRARTPLKPLSDPHWPPPGSGGTGTPAGALWDPRRLRVGTCGDTPAVGWVNRVGAPSETHGPCLSPTATMGAKAEKLKVTGWCPPCPGASGTHGSSGVPAAALLSRSTEADRPPRHENALSQSSCPPSTDAARLKMFWPLS